MSAGPAWRARSVGGASPAGGGGGWSPRVQRRVLCGPAALGDSLSSLAGRWRRSVRPASPPRGRQDVVLLGPHSASTRSVRPGGHSLGQRRLPSSGSSQTRKCGRWSVLWVRTSPQQGPGRKESDRSVLEPSLACTGFVSFRERPRTELILHCELQLPLFSCFSSQTFPSLSSESLLVAECLLVP